MYLMINNPNIGYRSSSARTIIRKYGTGWNEWKRGNFKPNKYFFGYSVKIVFCGIFGNDRIEKKTFQNRNTAIIYRDNVLDNLENEGFTIISSSVSLVRL